MIRALRSFEVDLQHRLDADGFTDVTVAHTNVLRHLSSGGMRLKDLATDAAITKQGISQAARALQARDLVAIESDPDDRRAKRVIYTDRGRRLIACALGHIVEIEREWANALGVEGYQGLRSALEKLQD